ncbi:MAG: sulfurtransferase [Methanotrichaceae archaeon]|nr:sulfurtransferase [Methanotrichaceae archaeon]
MLLVLVTAFSLTGGCVAVCTTCGGVAPDNEDLHREFLDTLGPETEEVLGPANTAQKARLTNPAYQAMLDNESGISSEASSEATSQAVADVAAQPLVRSSAEGTMLVSVSGVSRSDLVLDVGDGAESYIDGAIHIEYSDFFDENKRIKSIPDLAAVLGQAGISREDSLVIYGECIPCGGGPSAATFAYWVMRYLGHDRVRLLDGGVAEWAQAGFSVQQSPSVKVPVEYLAQPNPDLLSNYEYLTASGAQIVDARSFMEFGSGSIPRSINIPYEEVLQGGRLKDAASLKALFSKLNRDQPVVVYDISGVKASAVWFALTMDGFDARLYSWSRWLDQKPTLNIDLASVWAEPNPSTPGPVEIYVSFEAGPNLTSESVQLVAEEAEPAAEEAEPAAEEPQPVVDGNDSNLSLNVMGCATCEPITIYTGGTFGANKASGVQLGSYGQTAGGDFACQVVIKNSQGGEVARVAMNQAEEDLYKGVWEASGAAEGRYVASIIVSASGISKTFADVLSIEIAGDAPATTVRRLGR